MIKRFSVFLLSVIRRHSSDDELNGNLEKAIDIVLLVRDLLEDWSDLSDSARYQMLLIIEDRAGNLATSIEGWHKLAEERKHVVEDAKQEIGQGRSE